LFNATQKVIKSAEADPKAFAEASNSLEPVELAARRYGVTECPISGLETG
jgi:hypothetical protein